MELQDKYRSVIDIGRHGSVTDFKVEEKNNVLYINGKTTEAV